MQALKSVVSNARTMSRIRAKTAADPSKVAVKAWMKKNVSRYVDPKTGEVNMTTLAEDAAGEFDKKDLGGWLDDETHWIWDAAQEVAEAHEKTSKKATSSDQYEIGAKLIESGANGKLTSVLSESLKKIEAEFKDAERVLKKHISMGVGRTESPALLLRPLREMANLRRTLDMMIKSALHNTGSRDGDL